MRLRSELEERGAAVELTAFDALRFRMPRPWRAPRPGWLLAVTSGRADISGAGGGPWRVRYALDFAMLRIACLALSVVLAYIGRGWPRLSLLNALLILWLSGYLFLSLAATARFSRLLRTAARDMIERRRRPRPDSDRQTQARSSGGAPGGAPADAPADAAADSTADTATDTTIGGTSDAPGRDASGVLDGGTSHVDAPRADATRIDPSRIDAPRPESSRPESPRPDLSA